MQGHPLLRRAALIAETFHLDPVAVLEERDLHKRAVRAAAHNVIQAARQKAAK
jgi:hypothetical protein